MPARARERVLLMVLGLVAGLAMAADYVATAEPDAGDSTDDTDAAGCDCPTELSETNARLDAIEATLAKLDTQSPGLVAYDALGNELGQVLNVKQSVDFIEYLIFNKTLNTAFWVPPDGKVGLGNVRYESDDCSGPPYGVGPGMFGDGSGTILVFAPESSQAQKLIKSQSGPHDPDCELVAPPSGFSYGLWPLLAIETPGLSSPLQVPLTVK